MNHLKTIISNLNYPLATVILNRPEVHHAMDIGMIRELTSTLTTFGADPNVRIILIHSTGDNFSAGADLNWMRDGMNQTEAQLKSESMELAQLFRLITEIPPVVVSAVKGKVMGGANGIVAASDLVLAEETASFAFSEVKLGLVPATIAPFVIRKSGKSLTASWMLTGRQFNAREALNGGLIHFVCQAGSLELEIGKLMSDLLANGPEALKGIKKMIRQFSPESDPATLVGTTAEIIARCRISDEGQEGMNAFFEKRKPGWNVSG
jgi:methylglutaconyl-CoA hydratase